MMTPTLFVQIIGVVLTAIGLIVVPILAIIAKSVIKMEKVESKVDGIGNCIHDLKEQMDKRITFLEERVWGKDAIRREGKWRRLSSSQH